MKQFAIALVLIALILMPNMVFAAQKAVSPANISETATLTPSTPVEFPTKVYKFDNGETAKIGAKYEVGLNDSAEPQVVLKAKMEFPGGNTIEKTLPMGEYAGPTEINITPAEFPEDGGDSGITPPNEPNSANSLSCGYVPHPNGANFSCVNCSSGLQSCSLCWGTTDGFWGPLPYVRSNCHTRPAVVPQSFTN